MSHTILHIATSPMAERSVSRKLAAKTLEALQAKYPESTVVTRDLAVHPLPHLDGTILSAFFTPADQRNAALAAAAVPSDRAIDEIFAADIIVIDAPMWNFGIPSVLKAWIDHISRAGRTFKYTAMGAQSLLPAGKKAIIISSRGGIYSEGPAKAMDHQETYLTAILAFIGITDVSFVRAEGVAMGEEAVKKAMTSADAEIAHLLGPSSKRAA